ncbi:uncharacterized protein F4812DRAFT_452049 [Daldinia caldariorum]|uniref:uncharacterized protein n=1 Tax=Daldinia caldariorum TaxID=326644 RepID=UPI0020080A7A|nr:uncharacterized protein F4812DRAFT_452049 [Daldinia caldariorum]KAI1466139.1 hypothetical protein F4812DRAFT_452049 [Daldinia caldariorum]
MEALAAFGLAANIAQFVVMAGKTIEKTIHLSRRNQSLLAENADLEIIVQDFIGAVPIIRRLDEDVLRNDGKLKSFAESGKRIADEIQEKFDRIKARRAKRRRIESLFATLKELKMAGELDSLSARLAAFRSEITLHINLKLLDHQEQIKQNLNGLTESNRAYKSRIETQLAELTGKIDSLTITESLDDTYERVWKGTPKQFTELVNGFHSWYPQILDFQKTQRIINSLEFSQIEERRNAIPEAHKNTYKWVFDGDVANLKSWLTTEDAPIYWVTGNAGSGKSTLMKYIREHPRLSARLRTWAGSRKLYVASHFFWSAGTPMQQSQEGLLRTLLFQILLERPDLVSRVFSKEYNTPQYHLGGSRALRWTTKELLDALISLPTLMVPDCLFIFIDGLDEYSGEHEALLQIIKSLGKLPNIKLCVASRPWLDFIDAFEDSPWKLYLQHLTNSDIEMYVRDHLEPHPRFKQLRIRDENAARGLVEKITSRAQGVFLWVYLVVKSMIRGLVNADSMRDLHRRLDDLPQQLEDFFDRILASIDDFYKTRTSRVFLVLAHSRTPMSLISFYFLDREEGLPFDPDLFLLDWPAVNETELEVITTKKRQLIAQCKDLIQIIERPKDPIMFNFTASFLHRTVIDFINQPRIHENLVNAAGASFNPITTLFETNARQFQSLIHLLPRVYLKPYLRDWYLASTFYAREIEVTFGKSKTQQLDQMNESLISYLEERGLTKYAFNEALSKLFDGQHSIATIPSFRSFADLAIDCGLRLYISDKGLRAEYEFMSLKPTLCIEQTSGFSIERVPEDPQSRRRVATVPGRQPYSNTFHMFTEAEEKLLAELEKIHRSGSFTPQLGVKQDAEHQIEPTEPRVERTSEISESKMTPAFIPQKAKPRGMKWVLLRLLRQTKHSA